MNKLVLNPYYKEVICNIISVYGYRVNSTQYKIAQQLKVREKLIHNIFKKLSANDLLEYEFINGTRRIYHISRAIKHYL